MASRLDKILHKGYSSPYGGQGANAFVQGLQGGYAFADKAIQDPKDRANKQRMFDNEAKMREQQIQKASTENKLMNMAYNDVNGTSEQMANMQKTNDAMQAQITKSNGVTMNKETNYMAQQDNSKSRSEALKVFKSRFKTNPEVYKALGIKNAQGMSIMNKADEEDRAWMMNTLSRNGITPESNGVSPDSKEWADTIDGAIEGYPVIKADGAYVDLVGLSVATGAANMASPEHTKIMEKNLKELRARTTRRADNVEAVLSGKQAPNEPNQPLVNPKQAEYAKLNKAKDQSLKDIESEKANVAKSKMDIKNKIAGIETSNNNYDQPANANGYEGKYQFRYRDKNDAGYDIAKKLGYTPDEIRKDGNKQEEVMDYYMDQNASGLKKKGHEASPYNLWVAHNQGVGGANAILTGKLTDTVRRNIKNQGVKGDSDEELISNYHAKFAPKMGANVDEVRVSSVPSGQSDMKMRKVYALLGKKYPGYDEKIGRKSQLERLYDAYDDAVASGNTDRASNYKQMIQNTIDSKGATKTKVQYDRARKKIKELSSLDSMTPDQQDDYASAQEVIQGYEKTSKEQGYDAEVNIGKEGRAMADTATDFLTKNPDNKKALGDLETAQRKLRQANPKTYGDEKKAIEELKQKQISINQTADVLNRINHGDLQDIKRGTIDSAKQWASTKIDSNTKEWLNENLGVDWEKETTANLKKNSALGLLQAAFIKSISGATVTDNERADLLRTMVGGGGFDDEESLKTSLTEFYESNKEAMAYSGNQLAQGTSPYAAHQFSSVTPLGAENVKERGKTGKKIVKRGTLADGTKVVMYEDGTQGVE